MKRRIAGDDTQKALARRQALMQALRDIDDIGGKLEGGGAILVARGAYLSGNPYLFNSAFDRAFRFASLTQAEAVLRKFPDLLMDFHAESAPEASAGFAREEPK